MDYILKQIKDFEIQRNEETYYNINSYEIKQKRLNEKFEIERKRE